MTLSAYHRIQASGIPTRFNYVPVPASSFALTHTEILLADDKDLNEYMGLKKFAPYRKDRSSGWDSKRAERLQDFKEKQKMRSRRWGNDVVNDIRDSARKAAKKRKGKKERNKLKAGVGEVEAET